MTTHVWDLVDVTFHSYLREACISADDSNTALLTERLMKNNLKCLMQVQMNDDNLDNTPSVLTKTPTSNAHVISSQDNHGKQGPYTFHLSGHNLLLPNLQANTG